LLAELPYKNQRAVIHTLLLLVRVLKLKNNVVCANAGMAIATVNGCSPLSGFLKWLKESLPSD
jgi:hypothetical protein